MRGRHYIGPSFVPPGELHEQAELMEVLLSARARRSASRRYRPGVSRTQAFRSRTIDDTTQ